MGRALLNPLRGQLEADGAVWTEVRCALGEESYEAALDFGDVVEEHRALRESAALLDLSQRETLTLTGRDRAKWLHGLCTQQVKKLGELEGAYGCHINIKGKLLADLWVSNVGEMLVLDVEPGVGRALRRMLKGYKVSEDVTLLERSELFGSLGVVGPRAAAILTDQTGVEVSGLASGCVALAEVAGVECMIVATPQFGPPGFRVTCLREQLPEVWGALRAREVRPAGYEAQERARLRFGRPRFGADLSEDLLFNEADLTDAVSFTKGCYLGQEVVERVDSRGSVGRRLLGLRFEDGESALPAGGTPIRNAERELGHVTSAAYLDDVGCVVALAVIHRADNAPGTVLEVGAAGASPRTAVVTERGAIVPQS